MLISATRGEIDGTWLNTTREIHAYLVEKGLQDMTVELADPTAFEPLLTFRIKDSDKIFHGWEKVRTEVLNFLDPNEVNMVGCYRRGRDESDNFLTVIVVVDTKINKSWKATRERIIAVLDSYRLPMVGVEIMKGTVKRATKSPVGLHRSYIQGPAHFGASLGLEGLTHASSTFGGFVELKHPDTGEWVTFGLTCYHCVVPPLEKSKSQCESPVVTEFLLFMIFISWVNLLKLYAILDYRTWDARGVRLSDPKARQMLFVHHPSIEDLENQLADIVNEEKSKIKNAQYKEWCIFVGEGLLDQMSRRDQNTWKSFVKDIGAIRSFRTEFEQFLSHKSYKFGSVFAASGYRNVPSNTMKNPRPLTIQDWALISIPKERLGRNMVSTFYNCSHSGTLLTVNQIREDLELRESKSVNLNNRLHIRGRTTGDSHGLYGDLKGALVAEEVKDDGSREKVFTTEHSIVGNDGKEFSKPGDTGSLVWNDENAMVGILFAGCPETRTSYFTHKADLFADISSMTGARGVRVLE